MHEYERTKSLDGKRQLNTHEVCRRLTDAVRKLREREFSIFVGAPTAVTLPSVCKYSHCYIRNSLAAVLGSDSCGARVEFDCRSRAQHHPPDTLRKVTYAHSAVDPYFASPWLLAMSIQCFCVCGANR